MLECPSQIITVAEVEVTIQVNIREHSKISLFQWMSLLHWWLTHSNHNGVFDGINYVFANYTTFCAFCHQNHVIAFHKTNKSQHTICTNFLNIPKIVNYWNRIHFALCSLLHNKVILTLHWPKVPTSNRIPLASYSLGYSWNFRSVRAVRSMSKHRNFVSRSLLPTNNKR